MAEYIDLELTVDTDALANIGLSYLEDTIPGWTARPGNIETVLLEADSQIAAEVLDQASQVAPAVYATIGQTIYGIARQPATPAVATATFTFAEDTPVVMVDANTQLLVPNPSGDDQVFLTDADITAPAGGGTRTVTVTAQEPGATANGSFGAAELITDVDGVDTVTVTDAQGGADEEDIDAYLDRLTNLLTLLAPRPILPEDHATLALQVPGVGRALAIDLYMPPAAQNPVGDTTAPEYNPAGGTNIPRCTTVAITPEDASVPADTALKTRVYQALNVQREVNFLNYAISASLTRVDVQATVTAYPGFLPADVKLAAENMLRVWLDPNQWGAFPGAGTVGWALDNKARIYEAVDYLNRANGVFYVTAVQLRAYPDGGTPGAWQSTDVTLPGTAPLPLPGSTITVTANLP